MNQTAEQRLMESLRLENFRKPKAWYRPGEVQRIFNISAGQLRRLCLGFVDPGTPGYQPGKIESHKVGGERRIPHSALVRFIEETHCYNRIAAKT